MIYVLLLVAKPEASVWIPLIKSKSATALSAITAPDDGFKRMATETTMFITPTPVIISWLVLVLCESHLIF